MAKTDFRPKTACTGESEESEEDNVSANQKRQLVNFCVLIIRADCRRYGASFGALMPTLFTLCYVT